MSVSFDPHLGDAIREAAARGAMPLSTWMAEAAAAKLRAEALTDFLAAWESESGPLSPAEIARAERELHVDGQRRGDLAA